MDVGESMAEGDFVMLSRNGLGADSPYSGASPMRSGSVLMSRQNSKKDNECITHIAPIILHQRWTISNFAALIKLAQPGHCLRSEIFKDAAQPEACWQLCLYPGGKREENANNVSLFLKMSAITPTKEVCVKAEYRFFFIDDNDQPRFTNVNIGDFHAKPPKGGHSWGLRNIPKQKVLNSIRSDNSLVISCVIELMPDVTRVPCKKLTMPVEVHTPMMKVTKEHAFNELQMFNKGNHTDMVIILDDGTRFNVHKFKMMSQSDVLRAMLDHDNMLETQSGEIRIGLFDKVAVTAMLEFMYAGNIVTPITVETYAEVMELADKYNLPSLKNLCEDQLTEQTSFENVIEIIALADRFVADRLMQHCLDVILSTHHRNRIVDSENWPQLKDNNPHLANAILERIITAEQQLTPPSKRPRNNVQ